MLGFPIRTPPDHSLVANSPGLIAGSNDLHRLLMPRHPPCALHSLSQQRQNNTRCTHQINRCAKQNHKNTRPTPQSRNEPDSVHRHHPQGKQAAPTTQLHTRNTPTPPRPQQGPAGGHITKMLASTMQISNNNPTNTLNHPTAASSKGRNRSPTTHHHLN